MNKKRLFILFSLITAAYISSYCQSSNPEIYYWINLGRGFFDHAGSSGVSLYGSADLLIRKTIESSNKISFKKNSYKIRYIRYSESVPEDRNGRLNELDFLYGKTLGSVNQFNISAGIGILQGYDYVATSNWPYTSTTYINKVYHTLNIPVEISICIIPIRFFGLGITGYCNINFKKPIFGIVGRLELGRIR